jgi:hypothetical protein
MFSNENTKDKPELKFDSVERINSELSMIQRRVEIFRVLNKNENVEDMSLSKEFFEGLKLV